MNPINVDIGASSLFFNNRFLDVNTPLLVGSLPAQQQETRILNEDFIGCIKDVMINNRMLDFAESLFDHNTEPGCPISRYR